LATQQNGQNLTVAITVGFTDRRPDVATKVANELITLFLAEDARNRTSRASETTKFLAQEVEKLQAELATPDQKKLESRRQMLLDATLPQLTALKAELAAKSAIYSDSHPEIKRLKAQIEAVEKAPLTVAQTPFPNTNGNLVVGQMLDPLLL